MNYKNKFLSYFIGEPSAQEKTALESWKRDAESNLLELKNMMSNQNELDLLQNYQEVDRSKAWDKIQSRTDMPVERSLPLNIRSIAAIFIFLIAGIWGIFYLLNDKTTTIEYAGINTPLLKYGDGSIIDIDQTSTLQEKGFREFSLKGRAYFDVARDEKKPFIVHLIHGKLEVLGTEFNIQTTNQKTEIWVAEGKVKVTYNNKEYLLQMNDKIVIDDNQVTESKNTIPNPDSWRNKMLKFENNSLKQVMQSISAYYDVTLLWPASLKEDQCKINTTFQNESLNNVLKELEIISGLKFELTKNNTLIVKSYKC